MHTQIKESTSYISLLDVMWYYWFYKLNILITYKLGLSGGGGNNAITPLRSTTDLD